MHLIDDLNKDEPHVLSVLFRASMWWRISYGSLRLILGFMLLRVIGTPFSDLFYHLMSHEVTEDPKDEIFQLIYNILQDHSFTVTYFVAAYLVFWGVIDVFLSICLLRHKLWAFPVSTGLIALFILYEIYRIFHTHSLILLWIIFIDIIILAIIHREYLVLKEQRSRARTDEPKNLSLK